MNFKRGLASSPNLIPASAEPASVQASASINVDFLTHPFQKPA